jgi:Leucine Rich repeat
LNIKHNQIGDNGAKHLADALKDNTVRFPTLSQIYFPILPQTLTTLVLADNQIGRNGAQYIADILRNNKVISVVNMLYFC